MNNDVRSSERAAAFFIESESVPADVAWHSPHSAGDSAAKSSPSSDRSRSKQSFLMTSRASRAEASARRPGRTSNVTSASGNSGRCVRQCGAQEAVAPVMKKRFPRRSRSMGIGNVYHRPPILSTIW